MDKIESLGESFSFRKSEKKRIKKHKLNPPKFVSFFESASSEELANEYSLNTNHDECLEELLDQIHERGDKLKDSATMVNIKQYRDAVKAFLSFVVDHMFEVEKKISGVSVFKKKRLTLIHNVDSKLESLVTDILRGQAKQLDILSRVDEINGLLVNILS